MVGSQSCPFGIGDRDRFVHPLIDGGPTLCSVSCGVWADLSRQTPHITMSIHGHCYRRRVTSFLMLASTVILRDLNGFGTCRCTCSFRAVFGAESHPHRQVFEPPSDLGVIECAAISNMLRESGTWNGCTLRLTRPRG